MSALLELDGRILLLIQDNLRSELWTWFWRGVTFLGNGGWFWIALGIALLFFKKTRFAGLTALLSLLLCFLITNLLLKNLVARPRPYEEISALIPLIAKPTDYSFPSGHACASFASAFMYIRTLPRRYGVMTIVLASMIAFSRLYLGVHYPSDILGGIAVAAFGSWLVSHFAGKICRKRETIEEIDGGKQNNE